VCSACQWVCPGPGHPCALRDFNVANAIEPTAGVDTIIDDIRVDDKIACIACAPVDWWDPEAVRSELATLQGCGYVVYMFKSARLRPEHHGCGMAHAYACSAGSRVDSRQRTKSAGTRAVLSGMQRHAPPYTWPSASLHWQESFAVQHACQGHPFRCNASAHTVDNAKNAGGVGAPALPNIPCLGARRTQHTSYQPAASRLCTTAPTCLNT